MFDSIDNTSLSLLHGLLIVFGLVFCFFGFRVFKLGLAFIYAFLFASLGAYLGYEMSGEPLLWTWIGFFSGGILGALFSWYLYSLTVATAGAIAVGIIAFPYLQSFRVEIQWVATCVLAAAAGLFGLYLANLAIAVVSAFAGAILVVLGAQYFRGEGYLLFSTAGEDEWILHFEQNPWMLVIALVFGLLGLTVQRSSFRPKDSQH